MWILTRPVVLPWLTIGIYPTFKLKDFNEREGVITVSIGNFSYTLIWALLCDLSFRGGGTVSCSVQGRLQKAELPPHPQPAILNCFFPIDAIGTTITSPNALAWFPKVLRREEGHSTCDELRAWSRPAEYQHSRWAYYLLKGLFFTTAIISVIWSYCN